MISYNFRETAEKPLVESIKTSRIEQQHRRKAGFFIEGRVIQVRGIGLELEMREAIGGGG